MASDKKVPEHSANVATQAGPHGTTALAWCPCGFQKATNTRDEAQAKADAHVRLLLSPTVCCSFCGMPGLLAGDKPLDSEFRCAACADYQWANRRASSREGHTS